MNSVTYISKQAKATTLAPKQGQKFWLVYTETYNDGCIMTDMAYTRYKQQAPLMEVTCHASAEIDIAYADMLKAPLLGLDEVKSVWPYNNKFR